MSKHLPRGRCNTQSELKNEITNEMQCNAMHASLVKRLRVPSGPQAKPQPHLEAQCEGNQNKYQI